MKPNLNIITNNGEVLALLEYLKDKTYIAIDTETTGLLKTDQVIGYSVCADESEAFYVILRYWDVETQKLEDLETLETATVFMESLKDKKLICHNSVFDMMMIESNFKVSLIQSVHTDTLILAHLLNENRKIGLKDLSKEYFGDTSVEEQRLMKESVIANGGKLTKNCFELYKAGSRLLAKYGAQDALLTFRLFNVLIPELFNQGLDQFFFEDESMPLLRTVTYELNTVGLRVDTHYLASLKKQLQAECLEAKDFIHAEIKSRVSEKYPGTNKKNTFNISSNQQLARLMFVDMQLEIGTLTKEGQVVCRALGLKLPYTMSAKRDFIATCEHMKGKVYQPEAIVNGKKVKAKLVKGPECYIGVDKKILQKHAAKYKWIAKLLEYKEKTKILETYVIGIEERMKYGVINPSYLQAGTTSGRYSSRNPNLQNLPRNDNRVKKCFIARPGKVFVGADYSQLEPRVFAFYSKDERLLKAFKGTDDFYSVIGMSVYGKTDCLPIKEGHPDAFGVKYKKLRDLSKVIALASTYGATSRQLAPTTGKNIEDTQQDIDNYFEEFPQVKEMMLDAHRLAKSQGYVANLFGRLRRIPEAMKIPQIYGKTEHAELPYTARSLLNLAVNHRIQSTGASIVNRSAIAFINNCKEAGIKALVVNSVHDSIIVECLEEDSENVVLLLQHSMENTIVLKGVNLEAIPKVGANLSEV